jgi:hypothetical protein
MVSFKKKIRKLKKKNDILLNDFNYKDGWFEYLNRRKTTLCVSSEVLKELDIPITEECVERDIYPLDKNGYPTIHNKTVIYYMRSSVTQRKEGTKATCHKWYS